MAKKQINRRIAAVKTADAINAIEGAPVSHYVMRKRCPIAGREVRSQENR